MPPGAPHHKPPANLPAYTPAGSVSTGTGTIASKVSGYSISGNGGSPLIQDTAGLQGTSSTCQTLTMNAQTFTGTAQGGTSTAFGVVPPTIVCNYILRII